MASNTEEQQQQQDNHEPEIHVDVLETIISYVPLIHLDSASCVSRSWHAGVRSSLGHRNKPKPWLILHLQSTRTPNKITTHAYDPRSDLWMTISQPAGNISSAIRSSFSNLLYMLSPCRFSFTFDQLDFDWCHVDPPRVWRVDPMVARVGDYIVIAGGVCEFEDDPLAVESYCLKTGSWSMCESMPERLGLTSVAFAVTHDKLIVTVKQSGLTHWFDPLTNSWSELIVLDLGKGLSRYHIGYVSKIGLVMFGVCTLGNAERIKVWRVSEEDFSCKEIGEMPRGYVKKLRSESWEYACMDIRMAGNTVYVYNAWEVEEVVACEFEEGGGCTWWSLKNAVACEDLIGNQLVYACSKIGFQELRRINDRSGVVNL